MTDCILYRNATSDDYDSIIELGTREGAYPYWATEELQTSLSIGLVVVAHEDDRLVGFRFGIKLAGDVFVGMGFLVDHEYRSQGIGRGLSEFMFEELRAKGYSAYLTGNTSLMVSRYRDPMPGGAARFYLSLGCEVISETETTRVFIKHF